MTKRLINILKRWPSGCLLFLCVACNHKGHERSTQFDASNFQLISKVKPLVRDGDVIFRNGTDEVSHAARSMNRIDTSFSHCGLILVEHDSVFVYHALGGIYNPSQRLRRDPIDSFCTPLENSAFGIYRYSLDSNETDKLQRTVHALYNAGLPFDVYFNFFTNDKMYCSEFVFKSLNYSMKGALTKYIRLDTIPVGVTSDDLFLNNDCKLIKRDTFKY